MPLGLYSVESTYVVGVAWHDTYIGRGFRGIVGRSPVQGAA
eukprot:COSAG05_NODE_5320_length_1208_cov_1.611362_3_plen_40_part_01